MGFVSRRVARVFEEALRGVIRFAARDLGEKRARALCGFRHRGANPRARREKLFSNRPFWALATAFSAARRLSVVGRPLGPSDMHGAADARPGATVSVCQANHLCADVRRLLLV